MLATKENGDEILSPLPSQGYGWLALSFLLGLLEVSGCVSQSTKSPQNSPTLSSLSAAPVSHAEALVVPPAAQVDLAAAHVDPAEAPFDPQTWNVQAARPPTFLSAHFDSGQNNTIASLSASQNLNVQASTSDSPRNGLREIGVKGDGFSNVPDALTPRPTASLFGVVNNPKMQQLPLIYPVVAASLSETQNGADATDSAPSPAPRSLVHLPIDSGKARDDVQLSSSRALISLTARDAPLNTVLAMIAEQHGLNVVTGADVTERISVSVTDTRLEDALDAILDSNGYTWTRRKNIVIISKIAADQKSSAGAQGRGVQVFTLNYVAATDIDKVVKGLLSPVGQSFINQTMPTDHRRAHEQLVVEDLPEYLRRIEEYLVQADTPPRQVLIEAHVLQVTLKDNCKHGVNLQEILHIAHTDVSLDTVGLGLVVPPTSSLKFKGTEVTNVLEAIKATTDAKTLASPKVAVLNNQEAHMQVGGKIGYLLTTTTQTSTLQSVNFLDVGVILNVLPSITDDGQIMIQVKPQVSTGRINPTTQLPESETTEVETSVLLGDGEAIVIGGLIKETDNDSQTKVPFLGDLWLVGWIFQRRETTRERNEIIITLLPRIIPDDRGCRSLDPRQVQQAHTPLLYGPLESMDRSEFEPQLPCSTIHPCDRPCCRPPGPTTVTTDYIPFEESTATPAIFLTPQSQSLNDLIKPQAAVEPVNFHNAAEKSSRLTRPREN